MSNDRQFTASCYVIDFDTKETLLMYNKKLKLWLQPGGHIEGLETPQETAIRECKEETGIDIRIVGPYFFEGCYQPVGAERYVNSVGDMIDIQYVGQPLNKIINSSEGKEVRWIDIDELQSNNSVSDEIKVKVLTLYNTYKNR